MRSIIYWKMYLSCSLLVLYGGYTSAQQISKKKPNLSAETIRDISTSHIKGNAPQDAVFAKYLQRDLITYFTKLTGKKLTVEYEFLRQGATQSGLSYPKYYLWVKLRHGKRILHEGAVRVAAIEQKQFEVTDYLSKADMKKSPLQIEGVFPPSVAEKIRQRLK